MDKRPFPMTSNFRHFPVSNHQVIDGGSLELEIDLGFNIKIKQLVKLKNLDVFDIADVDPEIRKLAALEKAKLEGVLGRAESIAVDVYRPGKYSRVIGVLYADDKNVNRIMVNYHAELMKQVGDCERQRAFR